MALALEPLGLAGQGVLHIGSDDGSHEGALRVALKQGLVLALVVAVRHRREVAEVRVRVVPTHHAL